MPAASPSAPAPSLTTRAAVRDARWIASVAAVRRLLERRCRRAGTCRRRREARPHFGHDPGRRGSRRSLDEQHVDAAVRRRFERLLPARRRRGRRGRAPPASARARSCSRGRAPRRGAAARPRAARSARRAPRRSPSRRRLAGLGRERALDLAAQLLRRDDHDLQAAAPARAACRSRRRPSSGAAARAARCAAGSAPATSRPGRAGPALLGLVAISSSRPPRRRGRRCRARARRRRRGRRRAAELRRRAARGRARCRSAPRSATGSASGSDPEPSSADEAKMATPLRAVPVELVVPPGADARRGRPAARACSPAAAPCVVAPPSRARRGAELNFVSAPRSGRRRGGSRST